MCVCCVYTYTAIEVVGAPLRRSRRRSDGLLKNSCQTLEREREREREREEGKGGYTKGRSLLPKASPREEEEEGKKKGDR